MFILKKSADGKKKNSEKLLSIQRVNFIVSIYSGTSPFDMTASVTSPSGITELCDVVSLDDSHYSIKFVPNEMGVHTVSVKHKDMHIPGKIFYTFYL